MEKQHFENALQNIHPSGVKEILMDIPKVNIGFYVQKILNSVLTGLLERYWRLLDGEGSN